MSPALFLLAAANIGLIFLLMAVPLGRRTVRRSFVIEARRQRVWEAVWPLGASAGWSGEVLDAFQLSGDRARLKLCWTGRDGAPIERVVAFDDVERGRGFTLRVEEDSSLDAGFWRNYRETVALEDVPGGCRLTILRSDNYRGVAFLAFRFFALRREAHKLKRWAETGQYRPGGWFEHPLTQLGFAGLSVALLWPLFGLHARGLVLAVILTAVVALHEFGHMAAFRIMGHRTARMIFVPLLGGLAIGARPYDRRFEVGFVALMGAGFSAFLMAGAMAASLWAESRGNGLTAAGLAAFAGIAAVFNLANLAPVWKFDGGQVLRQLFARPLALGLASCVILLGLSALGWAAGLPAGLIGVIAVGVLALSFVTSGTAVKPRAELAALTSPERALLGAGLVSTILIHGFGAIWAAERLL